MSSKRHRSHQGGTTPKTEPQHSPGVAQFSVSEVAQFSVSLDTWIAVGIQVGFSKNWQDHLHPRKTKAMGKVRGQLSHHRIAC